MNLRILVLISHVLNRGSPAGRARLVLTRTLAQPPVDVSFFHNYWLHYFSFSL